MVVTRTDCLWTEEGVSDGDTHRDVHTGPAPRGLPLSPVFRSAGPHRSRRGGVAAMGLTATLCERIAATRFEDLPPETVAAARRLVLDGLAVGVAGVAEEDAVPILARCM